MNTNISFFERKSYKESGKKEEHFDKVKQVHKKERRKGGISGNREYIKKASKEEIKQK